MESSLPARAIYTDHYAEGRDQDLHHQRFDGPTLDDHLDTGTTFEDFFADARLNPHASLITGVVCGVRVEDVDDPLMRKIRYLDRLVDELAKGKPMAKVLGA